MGILQARVFISCAAVFAFSALARGSLTHRYSFNDGTANDSVGNVNGALVNGATVPGGQLVFDPAINNGTNANAVTGQYLTLSSNVLKTRAFTVETWLTWRGGNDWQRILDFGTQTVHADGSTGGTQFIILTPGNANGDLLGQVTISGTPSNTDFAFASTTLSLNAEHEVAFTHDPDANTEALYIDGTEVATSSARGNPATATYSNFWIGRSQFSTDPFFNGTIDELRTYDTALAPSNIASDFAAGPNAVPEPVATGLACLGCLALLVRRRRRTLADVR